jgi:hypothetical protein
VIIQKMQISATSSTPRIIGGIILTISIAVLAFLALPSVWFWVCWEVAAAALVAGGCFGEWYLFKTAPKPGHEGEHRRRELQCILGVAIGVTMELIAIPHALLEARQLEKHISDVNERAALASERAATVESMNLLLRSNVVQLEKDIVTVNPLNQPVSDISASATIIMKTESIAKPPFGSHPNSWVELAENAIGEKTQRTLFLNEFSRLLQESADGYFRSDANGSNLVYTIQFRADRFFSPSPMNGFILADRSPMTPRHVLSKIKTLSFKLGFLPEDAEIVGGAAEILINGAFRKQFYFFRQRSGGLLYATNAVADNRQFRTH